MNRLANESSPYLLQHASNPVDWFPWGDEAFQEARTSNRPIFLSIGYSACHWCHVMEHESFDNPDIAALMNERFVNIKVDREERPDLDQIYMSAVMAMTSRGGWPMSVFLTHDLKPFYGGTYWPPESRMGLPGFRQVLLSISDAWKNRPEQVESSSSELATAVSRMCQPRGEVARPENDLLKSAMHNLLHAADSQFGGFGSAPKFPHPMDLRLLLRCHLRFNSSEALHVVRLTCDRMAAGGIYDHLGGGFARYSTDARWLVPHFEKMLYDNALLVLVYTELFQVTGDPEYQRIVGETLEYIRREMTLPSGAFCSAQDADSEGEEGRFFVWTPAEIANVLGPDDAKIFCAAYDVTDRGNWEGKNILNRPRALRVVAEEFNMTREELAARLEPMKRQLFDVRVQRIPPGTDDKLIASWNGLMISAMSLAGRVFGNDDWVQAANNALDDCLRQLQQTDGRLLHTARHGKASVAAFLDDYAALLDALLEVYQSTFQEARIDQAVQLAEIVLKDFGGDQPDGDAADSAASPDNSDSPAPQAFFYTSRDQHTPVTRVRDSQDGAVPSGNSLLATALLKLGSLTSDQRYVEIAEGILTALGGQLQRAPMSGAQSLIAADHLLNGMTETVFRTSTPRSCQMLGELRRMFCPGMVVAVRPGTDGEVPEESSDRLNGLFEGRTLSSNAGIARELAWVCHQRTCSLPISDVSELVAELKRIGPLN
ncbi:MAG: thioredoxin domain-containing protein, partial [Planctomycetaceae bacterium]|nr:thioredoxin domain-containing protein [Planctomycetaceae bacterium]